MFRKKIEKKNAEAAKESAAMFLYPQIWLQADKKNIEIKLLNDWAMGYIFGSLDAALQKFDVVHESDLGISVGLSIFRMMFPDAQPDGGKYYWKATAMQEREEFRKGVICGGTEITKAMGGETTGILGLGYFLRFGKKR